MIRGTLSNMNKTLRKSRKSAPKINKFFVSGANPLRIKLARGMPRAELKQTTHFDREFIDAIDTNTNTVIYNISNPKVGIPKVGGVMVFHKVQPILYIDGLFTPSTHPEKKKALIQISKNIAHDHKIRMIRVDCTPELKDFYQKEGFTIEHIKRESYPSSSNSSNSNASTESYNNTNIIGFTMSFLVPKVRSRVNNHRNTRSHTFRTRFPSPSP
jgi:hypothetical protein